MRLNELIVLLLELLARIAWPGLEERMARVATGLLPDMPLLAGHWVARFEDASHDGVKPVSIDATLKQFGRHVRGHGHVQGIPGDGFEFNGTIKRNVLYGSFARKDAHVLAGTGAFVLKVMADSKTLSGHCMWYDGLLDEVWVSPYSWRRQARSL